jgi:hypothetical protein
VSDFSMRHARMKLRRVAPTVVGLALRPSSASGNMDNLASC